MFSKNLTTKLMVVTLSNLNRFSKSFTIRLSDKFTTKIKIPPHLKRVATPPCEVCLREIVMLKKIQRLKIVVEKYSSNDVSNMKIVNKKINIYPATHRITDCITQLPQQRRKPPQQNHFAHHSL